ncbi:MAG: hypothetical protein J6B25_04630 [Clostridia bacterium]|nr:hypothetical protein [Clostridia bacterium]
MIDFKSISLPNLPQNKVKHVVVSAEYSSLITALKKYDIEPLFVSPCSDVISQVRNHSDMFFSYLGNGLYMTEKSQTTLNSALNSLGFTSKNNSVSLSQNYPDDVILNTCIINGKILGSAAVAYKWSGDYGEFIPVKQGYTKCSVCIVDEHSLITDDISIFDACKKLDIDALLVRKGSVKLNGFDYGFIGGCCGKISHDTLAFFGDIRSHCDYDKISSFLVYRSVDALSLCSDSLIDVGSIIPITEYCV